MMKNMSYVLLSIALVMVSWGSYGPLLNKGGTAMGNSHWLPFIFVGVAYFMIAVVAAWALLAWRGESGNWSTGGVLWSFFSGVVTAVGALGVILALTGGGSPIYVMPLIFGGAPVFNTLFSMWMSKTHRDATPWFYAGLILVILGAVVVLVFNPAGGAAREITFPQLIKVLAFVLLTAVCWGAYGPLLHKGQMQMGNSRLRPYLCVGAAYFVVAVMVPLILRSTLGEQGDLSFWGCFLELGRRRRRCVGLTGSNFGLHLRRQAGLCDAACVRRRSRNKYFHQHCDGATTRPHLAVFLCRSDHRRGRHVSVLVFAPRGAPHPRQPLHRPQRRLPRTAKS